MLVLRTTFSIAAVMITVAVALGTSTKVVDTEPVYAQQLEVPEEQTSDDLRGSRLVLLSGIDNAILRLGGSVPEQGGEFDTTHIAELLQTDQLNAAIIELNDLKAQVIDAFGQEAADAEVVPQIENLIGALEKQMPSPPPPPPAS
jgi:hypothetical protein